jgi:hypothetical protein
VIITSNQVQASGLGEPVTVEVFTEAEALAFLAERTGRTDQAGAAELGFLPLALAQAAAVIAAQHLDYPAYLARLRATRSRTCCSVGRGSRIRMAPPRPSCWPWTPPPMPTRPGCAAASSA